MTFPNHIYKNVLLSKILKELIQFNREEANIYFLMDREIKHIFPKKAY